MKRIMICAAAAIATLASCSKTETTYAGKEPSVIAFDGILSPMTKAALPDDADMGVYAELTTGGQYFENTQFLKINNSWSANPAKLYPNTGELRFTIYSPYISKDQYMEVSDGSIIYPVKENMDFLYGVERYVGSKSTKSSIKVDLRHAKTAVRFNIQAEAMGIYQIKKITLTKVAKTGKINVAYGSAGTETKVTWGEKAVSDLVLDTPQDVTTELTQFGTEDSYIIPSDTDNAGEKVMRDKIIIEYTMNGVSVPNFEKQLDNDWLAGRRYIFNVKFTDHVITFSPVVEDWSNVEQTLDPSNE